MGIPLLNINKRPTLHVMIDGPRSIPEIGGDEGGGKTQQSEPSPSAAVGFKQQLPPVSSKWHPDLLGRNFCGLPIHYLMHMDLARAGAMAASSPAIFFVPLE